MAFPTKIPLFRRFVLQNFPFIEQDFDALTDYQLICKVVEYLNKCIETVNSSTEQIELLTNAFNQLKDYVDTYFDNLDVQDEINHKLDEMASDGTLEAIINNGIFQHLDVADNYIVTNTKTVDDARTLIYYITRIHPNPEKTDHVALKGEFSQDTLAQTIVDGSAINMFNFSKKINSIVCSNSDTIGALRNVVIIRNGEVLREDALSDDGTICGFDSEGNLKVYSNCLNATEPLNDGIINTWRCSILINNGVVDSADWATVEESVKNERHPRTIMLQDTGSKDVIFLHIEGRKPTSVGVTFSEACTLIQALFPNVNNAVIFGGGGDSQLMIKGRMINDSNDDQLRPLHDIIYLDPNLTYDDNEGSLEIANARNSDVTMHDMLKNRINLTDNFKYSNTIMYAEVADATVEAGTINLVCNVDYNTVLSQGDAIIVKFPDLSAYPTASSLRLNIHYATEVNSPYLYNENEDVMQPMELSNQIRICYWTGSHYIVKNDASIIKNVTSVMEKDLDNYKTTGNYFSKNFTNRPSTPFNSTETSGFVKVYAMPIDNFVFQEYHTFSGLTYNRCFVSGAWTNWILLNSTKPNSKNNVDLNAIGNINIVAYGNALTNRPSSANGWVMNFGGATAGYGFQIYVERQTTAQAGNIYLRVQENGTWGDWKRIAFAS